MSLIEREAAIDKLDPLFESLAIDKIKALPSAQPERYTKEELKIFLHGISLRLLSLRSAQHWREDDERAKEIEFLTHLYEKVETDMERKE